jgi:hypothetical protein
MDLALITTTQSLRPPPQSADKEDMTWGIILIAIVGIWAMLTLIGGDRTRRLAEIQARLRAEAQAAAEAQAEAQAQSKSEDIISVG